MITGPINFTRYGDDLRRFELDHYTPMPRRARTMKSKTHAVTIGGKTYLVQAITKAGAVRDVIDRICDELRETAVVDLATGEQIYLAGKSGQEIIGHDRFKNAVGPNQMGLAGIPETAGEEIAP